MSGQNDISILRHRLRELLAQNREMRQKLALQIAENRKMSKELTRALESTLRWEGKKTRL
jgi:phage shock protein A